MKNMWKFDGSVDRELIASAEEPLRSLLQMIASVEDVIARNRVTGAENNSYWYGLLDGLQHAADPQAFPLTSRFPELVR